MVAGGQPFTCSTAHVVTVDCGAAAVTVTPRVVSMVVELVAAASVVVDLIVRCMALSTVAGRQCGCIRHQPCIRCESLEDIYL